MGNKTNSIALNVLMYGCNKTDPVKSSLDRLPISMFNQMQANKNRAQQQHGCESLANMVCRDLMNVAAKP
jgi:hypothetical protein